VGKVQGSLIEFLSPLPRATVLVRSHRALSCCCALLSHYSTTV
jgi:hypothetical protein